jgi:plastocyanin
MEDVTRTTTLLEEFSMRSSLLSGSAVAVAGAVIIMWGCGGSSSSPSAPSNTNSGSNSPTVTVTISSAVGAASFSPNPVPATTGNTIAFKNVDPTNTHHIIMDDGSGDLGDIPPGQTSKSITIKGSANFHCVNHPWMVGAVNQPVPDQPPCTGGPAYCD